MESEIQMTAPAPARWRVWMLAIRVPTLSAAVVPVLVGSAIAARDNRFSPLIFAVVMCAALLIQIGTNLTNDLFDFQKGADTGARLGPVRVVQAGLLSQKQVAAGSALSFGLAILLGLYLAAVGGWPIVAIGLAAVASGIAYTGGPWPLGYHGLGDVFVFVFFGVVAVVGTFYLQSGNVTGAALIASLPVAMLVTAILVVNNLRDIDTDRQAGKRTVAVRFGREATQLQYSILVLGAYLVAAALWIGGANSAWAMLPWLTLPLGTSLVREVWRGEGGAALNRTLRRTAGLHLVFGILLAASFVL
ncbi:MAG TPA: 1,4-dihydroxy-2-naphthoate polyprenyltransferase [Candidatus Binataceae bacterium]|nr:1,4-dihydroxy-2-naphthoate polyprenyltransferase [Candidatus Binataceae bacterium]